MTKSIPTWKKEADSSVRIVYRNVKNPSITIEAYDMEEQSRIEEDKGQWYVFGALNGRGISNSPEIVWGKKEAISFIAKLKDAYKKWGIDGLK